VQGVGEIARSLVYLGASLKAWASLKAAQTTCLLLPVQSAAAQCEKVGSYRGPHLYNLYVSAKIEINV